jgi:hypothetical protein
MVKDFILRDKSIEFELDGRQLAVVHEGKKYLIKQLMLGANGTRDLYMIKDKKGEFQLKQKDKIKPEHEVIYHYQDDVLILEFNNPPYPFGTPVLYLEMDDSLTPLIAEALRRIDSKKGSNYDAYIGRSYDSLNGSIKDE